MRALSQDLLWYGYWKCKMVTVTVVPTPSDATVTLTSTGYTQVGNSITLPIGATLKVTVAKLPSYNTYDPPAFVVTGPRTISIELSSAPTGVLDITPVPSDSTVTLSATGCTQVGNAITVPLGTSVHCTITPNNSALLEPSSTDIVVNETLQEETLYCNASVSISTTPADANSTITYNGNTYTGATGVVVPYGSVISYTASKSGYDTIPPTSLTVTQNRVIELELVPSTVTVSVIPYVVSGSSNIYSPNATVSLSTDAAGVNPVSGQGTQQIEVPIGAAVTYSVSQQYYDTETGVIQNITLPINQSVYMHAATLGVRLYDDDGTFNVPTSDPLKMAIITKGGNGGDLNSIKQIGGTGGGASGNTYVVDIADWEAGDVIGITFGSNNVIITKNGSDYATYANGGNGTSGNATDVSYTGLNGGSADAGNGGGGGSGGSRFYSVSVPHLYCAGASCHTRYSVTTYRGSISPGGDGGTEGNAGADGSGSCEIGSTAAGDGIGGSGVNATTGGAQNGGAYGYSVVAATYAGSKGLKGLGAVNNQSTILGLIQMASLTSAALRNLIQGGGGATGGVYSSNTSAWDSAKTVATAGTGGGGGGWLDGDDGANGVTGATEATFTAQQGGQGGHGCVIIWRPSDVSFMWGTGQIGS